MPLTKFEPEHCRKSEEHLQLPLHLPKPECQPSASAILEGEVGKLSVAPGRPELKQPLTVVSPAGSIRPSTNDLLAVRDEEEEKGLRAGPNMDSPSLLKLLRQAMWPPNARQPANFVLCA